MVLVSVCRLTVVRRFESVFGCGGDLKGTQSVRESVSESVSQPGAKY